MRSLLGKLLTRNSLLFVDTAMAALLSVLVVIAAARSLPAAELDLFAVAQVVCVTAVAITRASIYAPAMAVQKRTGRTVIPARWILSLSPLIGLPAGAVLGWTLAGGSPDPMRWAWSGAIALTLLLAQDATRSVLLSRDLTWVALVSDSLAIALLLAAYAAGLIQGDVAQTLLVWGLTLGCALAVGLCILWVMRQRTRSMPRQTLRATWVLGKWAALDNGLAAIATLLPIVVSALILESGTAGLYRTLQTAMGPLNIVHTTTVTAFSMDSWRLAQPGGVRELEQRTLRLTAGLTIFGALYAFIGIPLMSWISQLSGPELPRVGLVVAVAAVMGAATTGPNAGALALGLHRFGAIIRGVTVAGALMFNLPVVAQHLPWQDSIGATMLFAAVVAMTGWGVAFLRGRGDMASIEHGSAARVTTRKDRG